MRSHDGPQPIRSIRRRLTDPVKSFAIWHIHGDRALQRSIRAGLDQYMGMVERLRKLKRPVAREILGEPPADPARTPSYFAAPWLRIFMGRKLWIQGLGLHSDEVSLRWLLIQRFRLWKSFKSDEAAATGWYVHGPTEITGALDTGRRVFFESVGLQVIEIGKREEIYEKLFEGGPTSERRGKSKLRGAPQASSPGTESHKERVVTLQ